jgi:hypothetical protein
MINNAELSVLCVDDNYSWRRILQMHMTDNLTSNVDIADSYLSAVQKIKDKENNNQQYDLIISDGLDGECFKLFEKRYVSHKNFIILSSDDNVELKAKKLGIPFYNKSNALAALDKIVADYKPKD